MYYDVNRKGLKKDSRRELFYVSFGCFWRFLSILWEFSLIFSILTHFSAIENISVVLTIELFLMFMVHFADGEAIKTDYAINGFIVMYQADLQIDEISVNL